MVGRSNVGKSTLVNALAGTKIARTSAAPGKTRQANYYAFALSGKRSPAEPDLYLVDLPGYGYARGGDEAAASFEQLTTDYFDPSIAAGRRLAGVFHLVDARHPELESDRIAHEWLMRTGVPLAVIATKMDKLTRADRGRHLKALDQAYDTAILPVSAQSGGGIEDVWKMIRGWLL